jgi:hypothetical protein
MNFFTVTQVKATRKPCLCYWCPEHIEVGQPKTKTATVWEGDFQWNNFHPECFDALKRWQDQNPGEDAWPYQGEMKRGTTEPR